MSDQYFLNGNFYHTETSEEAQAAIARAGDASLITTVNGVPAWVQDGVCYVRDCAAPGANQTFDHDAVAECFAEREAACGGNGSYEYPDDLFDGIAGGL